MIEIEWLSSAAPILRRVPVFVSHGESNLVKIMNELKIHFLLIRKFSKRKFRGVKRSKIGISQAQKCQTLSVVIMANYSCFFIPTKFVLQSLLPIYLRLITVANRR